MNRTDYSFLLDEQACDDPITARFPRTSREAFGPHAYTPMRRFSFLPCLRGGWIGIVVAVAILAAFALA